MDFSLLFFIFFPSLLTSESSPILLPAVLFPQHPGSSDSVLLLVGWASLFARFGIWAGSQRGRWIGLSLLQ